MQGGPLAMKMSAAGEGSRARKEARGTAVAVAMSRWTLEEEEEEEEQQQQRHREFHLSLGHFRGARALQQHEGRSEVGRTRAAAAGSAVAILGATRISVWSLCVPRRGSATWEVWSR